VRPPSFPSVGEIAITVGLVATQTMIYLFLVRRLPVLGGIVAQRSEEAPPAAVKAGVPS